jgi:hypothetical protein
MHRIRRVASLLIAVAAQGCAPTLDWREVRPPDSAAVALFPCKPASHARQVVLAGEPATLTLHACQAGGATFALGHARMADPARVGPALQELRRAAAANLDGQEMQARPFRVEGMTPHDAAVRIGVHGRRPDGRAAQEDLAVFAKGTQVYQAVVLAPRIDAEVADTYMASLRLP